MYNMYVCCTVYMYAYLLVHKSKMLKSNNLEDINGRFFTPILLFSSVHILWQWAWVVCSVVVEQKSCQLEINLLLYHVTHSQL